MRAIGNDLLNVAQTNVHSMRFKLKVAVAAHDTIPEDIIRSAFIETEIWPVDYRFLNQFQVGHPKTTI